MADTTRSVFAPLILFAIANILFGLYAGVYEPSFNNYLAEVHNIGEIARGGLEFPRELPGFLCAFIFALFIFLPDTRIATIAALMVALSLFGQGFLAPDMSWVVIWMLMWSTGAHLFMVLKSSIALRLADKGHEGKLMGNLGALEAGGMLLGLLAVYFGVSRFNISFPAIFAGAGLCALLAAICLYRIKPQPVKKPSRQLFLKKKYTLFYALNLIFGARKQIFLTFAPWVLIKIYGCGVESFALLGIICTIIGLIFRPLLGRAIDTWGEKIVLSIDAVALTSICLLYALSPGLLPDNISIIVIMCCYVIDQLLFAVTIAKTTYLNRIIDTVDELAPTISMGITLDHAVSMTVPFIGGIIWAALGFQWVFLCAGMIGILSLLAAMQIPSHKENQLFCNTHSI